MIREVVEEAEEMVREMPGFTTLFLLLAVLSVGARCTVACDVEGDGLNLVAKNNAEHKATSRLDGQIRRASKHPGLTVTVGIQQYEMELRVPVSSVRNLWEVRRTA